MSPKKHNIYYKEKFAQVNEKANFMIILFLVQLFERYFVKYKNNCCDFYKIISILYPFYLFDYTLLTIFLELKSKKYF